MNIACELRDYKCYKVVINLHRFQQKVFRIIIRVVTNNTGIYFHELCVSKSFTENMSRYLESVLWLFLWQFFYLNVRSNLFHKIFFLICLQLPIPWKSLYRSKPLFINLLSQTGAIWGLFTLAVQAPTYFNFILGLNIKQVF